MTEKTVILHKVERYCADCGQDIGMDHGPPDGWRLEDGRIVCHSCCVVDTKEVIGLFSKMAKTHG